MAQINIELTAKSTKTEYSSVKKKIRNEVGKEKTGVYIILKEDRILYIGESKNIRRRLLKHIAKIYERTDQRADFFKLKENRGKLSIRYLFLDPMEESKRKDIENVLTWVLEPEYEKWKVNKSMKVLSDIILLPQEH